MRQIYVAGEDLLEKVGVVDRVIESRVIHRGMRLIERRAVLSEKDTQNTRGFFEEHWGHRGHFGEGARHYIALHELERQSRQEERVGER